MEDRELPLFAASACLNASTFLLGEEPIAHSVSLLTVSLSPAAMVAMSSMDWERPL